MTKPVKVRCRNCNKIIYRSTGRFNENLKFGHNFYCSRKCEYKYKTQKRELSCENCGENFLRQLNDISPHNYCSQSCAAIINNKRSPKRKAQLKICIRCRKNFKNINGNLKYCSMECRNENYKKTPESLIKIIKDTAKKLKRVPSRRELDSINDPCVKIFGSWNKAIEAAGFIPNRSHDNRMYKRVNAKAIDGHLCDSVSELLIDNWLHKNNILHERDAYYPTTHHKADWKIFSKNKEVFVEYFGLANDSPRYDRSIKEKETLCKKNNIYLIGIYPKDIYPKNYLEDTLKNKFRDFLN